MDEEKPAPPGPRSLYDAETMLMRDELRAKRMRLGITQRQAAMLGSIKYGIYMMAEDYGRIAGKYRPKVKTWIERPDEKDASEIMAMTREKRRK